MSFHQQTANNLESITGLMGFKPAIGVCEVCDWRYLLPYQALETGQMRTCPHCFEGQMVSITDQVRDLPRLRSPEAQLPFSVADETVIDQLRRYFQGIPFPPSDFSVSRLVSRMVKIYLPVWWVDVNIHARWACDAGFNYEVVSYQDQYNQNRGGWISREVTEQRIRWEPRAGRLDRTYKNIAVSAFEGHSEVKEWLMVDYRDQVGAYRPGDMRDEVIRFPDRTPEDAWGEAVPKLRYAAARECQKAIRADHYRDFQWQPEFTDQNWTMLLYPIYASTYLDDEGKHQTVFINGCTGEISGERRASMKRARRYALAILGVAGLTFVLSLLVSALGTIIPGLIVMGVVGMAVSLFIGLGALIPPAMVWNFNRS